MRACKAWIGCAVVLLCIGGGSVVSAQEAAAPSEAPQSPPAPPAPEPELIPTPPSTYVPPPAPAPAPAATPNAPTQPVNPAPRQSTLWPAPPVEPPPERAVSLTISPVHLFFPIVELTLEVAVLEELGIGLLAGIGSLSLTTSSASRSATVVELGASLRYYAIGDFSTGGMQLGAEVLYAHLFVEGDVDGSSLAVTGTGFAVGPMVGYKYVARSGFTFDGQLGVQWMASRAESESDSAKTSGIIPLLNVNIGWSF